MAYQNTYETADAAPAFIDIVVGVFAAVGGFATLIGLGVAIAVVGKRIPMFRDLLKV